MRNFVFIFALLSCWQGNGLLAQEDKTTLSLAEAFNYAKEHDLTLANARMNIDDAEEQIIESRAIGLPKLDGSVKYQHFFEVPTSVLPEAFDEIVKAGNNGMLPEGYTRQAQFALRNNFDMGLNLNSLIVDGSYLKALKAARVYRDYVGQELITEERKLYNKVREAYLPPLIVQESMKMLDKNITNLEKMLDETQKTYDAGFVEQLDVDRLELSLANLRTERKNLSRQLQLTLNFLEFTIGFPQDEELVISDNIESLLQEATGEELTEAPNYYNRPEYKLAEMGIQLNEINVDVIKAGYLPSLNGFASYSYSYQGNQLFHEDGFWFPTALVGVQLNVPIFDGFEKKAKAQRARLQLAMARNQKRMLEQAIDLEVTNARESYLNAKDQVASQDKNVALAERIFSTTQIKYREGVGSSIEVTQAEQSLYQAQQNRIQALYDLLNAKAQLDEALGN
ncbi:MAG: TolC family protein [Bacteroidota bacterium]